MRSLAAIRARLDELLADEGGKDEPPSTIVLLPKNERSPVGDKRPYPRVDRVGRAAIVVYDPAHGQPTDNAIRQLIGRAP